MSNDILENINLEKWLLIEHYASEFEWPLFPVQPSLDIIWPDSADWNQQPLVASATTDLHVLQEWWRAAPDAAIGLPTGAASRITSIELHIGLGGFNHLFHVVADDELMRPALVMARGYSFMEFLIPYSGLLHAEVLEIEGLRIKNENSYTILPQTESPSRSATGPSWVTELHSAWASKYQFVG